jgi:hypothetical protein
LGKVFWEIWDKPLEIKFSKCSKSFVTVSSASGSVSPQVNESGKREAIFSGLKKG